MPEALWTDRASQDLKLLDRRTKTRIANGVERFAATGHGNIRRVQGTGELALRIGKWRIFLLSRRDEKRIHVLRVRPRGSAYQP